MTRPTLSLSKKKTDNPSQAVEKTTSLSAGKDDDQKEINEPDRYINELLKSAFKKEFEKQDRLARKKAKSKNNQPKSKPKLTEVEKLRNQISALSKSNSELTKRIKDFISSESSHKKLKLLSSATIEIKKTKDRNLQLEKENKALRDALIRIHSEKLGLTGEIAFYGSQYSDPET